MSAKVTVVFLRHKNLTVENYGEKNGVLESAVIANKINTHMHVLFSFMIDND